MDDNNPYEPPGEALTISVSDRKGNPRAGGFTYVAWIFVFAINMAVPLLFSASVTQQNGRSGMLIGTLFLFVLGCYICAANRKLAVALLAGGAVVALTQLFPMLQFIAGSIGMGVGQALGHATFLGDDNPPRVTSEYGGFVVTFVTGGVLMAGSLCTGILLQLVRRFLRRPHR